MSTKNSKNSLVEELKKLSNFDDIKLVNKKILIPFFAVVIILLISYYYFLFSKYLNTNKENVDVPTQKGSYQVVDDNDNNAKQLVESEAYQSPAYHMNVEAIPQNETLVYTKAFEVIFNYFNFINVSSYQEALGYINPTFKEENGITLDMFTTFTKKNYYKYNDFFIHSITKNEDEDTYNIKLSIKNLSSENIGYFTNYKLVRFNGSYNLVIDKLIE